MEIFKNRFDQIYINRLCEILSVDSLIEKAIQLKDSTFNCDKFIRVDFFGISATTFLDISRSFSDGKVAKKFNEIFDSLNTLNEKGIFIKFRFLFSYLYSDFAFSMIEAGMTENRAAINENAFIINFNNDIELTEDEFLSSSIFGNQSRSLKRLQKLIEKNDINNINSPNKIAIRFCPLPINYSGFIINDFAAYESYSYAKKDVFDNDLSYGLPIHAFNQLDKHYFNEIEDHFRYLWNHETTLFCEDATLYDKLKPNSLAKVKKPSKVQFNSKGTRIKEIAEAQSKKQISESDFNRWKFKLNNRLFENTKIIQSYPANESIFIACCWKKQKDDSYIPNNIALTIRDYLENSLGKNSEAKILSPILVEPKPGSELSDKIYTSLKRATLALIILTDDVETKNGEFLASQNVVHELGFMMNQLNARETGRVIILKDKNVKLPSNVANYEYVEFDKDKFILRIYNIIEWLHKSCNTITYKIINESFTIYIKELEKARDRKSITIDEYENIINKIDSHKNMYKIIWN